MQNPPLTKNQIRGLRAWWEHHVLFEPKQWVQVEVTSRCNAACIYCPRTIYRDAWRNRCLSLNLFERLIPAFHKVSLVYLQGWGEPLLHPHLPAMIQMAKAAGPRVGTTTNGMLLDTPLAETLVDAGLDVIAFSLAGTRAATNDRVRAGTRLDQVLEKMALLDRIKQQRGSVTPHVHVAYMALASDLEELAALPALVKAACDVKQIVVSTLDFAPSRELAAEVLSACTPSRREKIELMFEDLKAGGRAMGIEIHTPRRETAGIATHEPCTENIQHALCISAEGEVSACMLTNIPVAQAHFWFHGRPRAYQQMTFGNIRDTLLPIIWRHPAYVDWRSAHADGQVPNPCTGCAKLFR
jgi:MoaA/NifB/PqqE/SkfB family radical SAM enzyme